MNGNEQFYRACETIKAQPNQVGKCKNFHEVANWLSKVLKVQVSTRTAAEALRVTGLADKVDRTAVRNGKANRISHSRVLEKCLIELYRGLNKPVPDDLREAYRVLCGRRNPTKP